MAPSLSTAGGSVAHGGPGRSHVVADDSLRPELRKLTSGLLDEFDGLQSRVARVASEHARAEAQRRRREGSRDGGSSYAMVVAGEGDGGAGAAAAARAVVAAELGRASDRYLGLLKVT